MLSICIPVYNYDAKELVLSLLEQCKKLNIKHEIIIIDDASNTEYINNFENIENVKHILLKKNIGRSSIRNKLAETAIYDKLLFLDCDSKIPSDKFIKNYIENFNNESLICGGTIYQEKQYNKDKSLRYWYGVKREMKTADFRNQNPNKSFTTNNFIISKSVFKVVKFREFLNKYGHEDSLFGFELKQNNIKIKHIDNPVIHCGIEDNQTFINKSKYAIENLIIIEQKGLIDKDFFDEIKLIKTYLKVKKTGLLFFQKIIFKIFSKAIHKNLIYSRKPSLLLFDLYKLNYYSEHRNKVN